MTFNTVNKDLMKIIKTNNGYSFDRSKYKSPEMIKNLYEAKLKISEKEQGKDLPRDIRKAYVILQMTPSDFTLG